MKINANGTEIDILNNPSFQDDYLLNFPSRYFQIKLE